MGQAVAAALGSRSQLNRAATDLANAFAPSVDRSRCTHSGREITGVRPADLCSGIVNVWSTSEANSPPGSKNSETGKVKNSIELSSCFLNTRGRTQGPHMH